MKSIYKLLSVGIFSSIAIMMLNSSASAFDCAKATTPTENAICARANLKAQDDAMTRVYFDLRKSLNKSAKSQLLKAQKSWLALRAGVCEDDSDCLLEETQLWTIKLNTLNTGMVPRLVWRNGDTKRFRIRIEGAVFAEPKNRAQEMFNREVERQILLAPLDEVFEVGQSYISEYEIFFEVSSSTNRLISGNAGHASYSGAHPSFWSDAINIDVQNGELLSTSRIFSHQAINQLTNECRDQVIKRKYESDEGSLAQKRTLIEEDHPGIVAKHILDMKEWTISATAAEIGFDKYDIGAGAEGAYSCEFPITKIKSLSNDPSLFSQ